MDDVWLPPCHAYNGSHLDRDEDVTRTPYCALNGAVHRVTFALTMAGIKKVYSNLLHSGRGLQEMKKHGGKDRIFVLLCTTVAEHSDLLLSTHSHGPC